MTAITDDRPAVRIGMMLILAGAILAPAPALAQQAVPDTVIRVIGLEGWTPDRLETEIQRHAPHVSLTSHACAVVLRDSVGFGDAAVFTQWAPDHDTVYVNVVAAGPPGSSPMERRSLDDRAPSRPGPWADVYEVLDGDDRARQAMVARPEYLVGATEWQGGQAPDAAVRLRRAIRRHDTPDDWELARAILLGGSPNTDRMVAALVMANFPDVDETWHVLVNGLLYPADWGTAVTADVLRAMAMSAERSVDWRTARHALHELFRGANLFAYPVLLEALLYTDIDPQLGRALAAANRVLLEDYARSRLAFASQPARSFIARIDD